jgi:hypothetical protein
MTFSMLEAFTRHNFQKILKVYETFFAKLRTPEGKPRGQKQYISPARFLIEMLVLGSTWPRNLFLALAEEFLLEPITKSNSSLYRIFK